MKLVLLIFVLLSSLLANKVIYFSYNKVPKRIIQGEIFPITLKTLSTVNDFDDINYSFSNYDGVKILTDIVGRKKIGKYFYDTFYLLSTQKSAKLPDIEASLISLNDYNSSIILGKELNIVTLNPKNNFSNIIANSLDLEEYKTTSYDDKHNIIVFVASAYNSDISAMKFKNVYKQGTESLSESYIESRITYFVVVDKQLENFSFTYFNLLKNKFSLINIPVIVDDDSVTTQSDLKPKDHSHEKLKMEIAFGIILVGIIFIILRRKYVYLLLVIIPLIYIGNLTISEQKICIKAGTQIHLLPVDNGTIFETTSSKFSLSKEGSVKNYIKVKLKNQKIGWVKNEDICTY